MRYFPILLSALILSTSSFAAESKNEEKSVCIKTSDLTKVMNEKNFFHLLNMENKNDVVETIWVGGTDVVITAQEKDTSCLIAMMKNVVYNPDTIEGLLKAYQNQQKKQKDI